MPLALGSKFCLHLLASASVKNFFLKKKQKQELCYSEESERITEHLNRTGPVESKGTNASVKTLSCLLSDFFW
jgi:hypothetical protein